MLIFFSYKKKKEIQKLDFFYKQQVTTEFDFSKDFKKISKVISRGKMTKVTTSNIFYSEIQALIYIKTHFLISELDAVKFIIFQT